jgi:hypothetical protein
VLLRSLYQLLTEEMGDDEDDKITKAIDCINVLKTNYESKI